MTDKKSIVAIKAISMKKAGKHLQSGSVQRFHLCLNAFLISVLPEFHIRSEFQIVK